MDLEFYTQLFVAITLTVDGIKQAVKPLFARMPELGRLRQPFIWASLLAVSIVTAFSMGADADLFANAGVTGINETAGILATGLVITLGANVAHNIFIFIRSGVLLVSSVLAARRPPPDAHLAKNNKFKFNVYRD